MNACSNQAYTGSCMDTWYTHRELHGYLVHSQGAAWIPDTLTGSCMDAWYTQSMERHTRTRRQGRCEPHKQGATWTPCTQKVSEHRLSGRREAAKTGVSLQPVCLRRPPDDHLAVEAENPNFPFVKPMQQCVGVSALWLCSANSPHPHCQLCTCTTHLH